MLNFRKHLPLVGLLFLVVALPMLLRPQPRAEVAAGVERLVIITPHNEAIRSEFGHAFSQEYGRKTGRRVRVDWRTPGGTSEIGRYVRSEYLAAFQHHWERTLGRRWSADVEKAWDNPKVAPGEATPAAQARKAFLESDLGCGIDLLFGGGAYDYIVQAAAGRLVPSGIVADRPEIFGAAIPQNAGGEPLWDGEGRWVGTCLSAFGICSNRDALERLRIEKPPTRWSDLTDPRYFQEIALANPTQSSSVNRAFEMLIQEQMQAHARALGDSPETEEAARTQGWAAGLQMVMRISANARYFTDSSTKIALDVTSGEAAAGMTIDFYGRFQSEATRRDDGTSRIYYADARGGTSVGADPIGMLRGAPHPALARAFIEFVMSPRGQKLWAWKRGAPGGPMRYELHRLPILPALYAADFRSFRTDPEVDPYQLAGAFTYRESWTGPLFRTIAFVVRVMCIDPHDELQSAWRALIENDFPPEATRTFLDVRAVNYATASAELRKALSEKLTEVQTAKRLADHFRAQYRAAELLARARR